MWSNIESLVVGNQSVDWRWHLLGSIFNRINAHDAESNGIEFGKNWHLWYRRNRQKKSRITALSQLVTDPLEYVEGKLQRGWATPIQLHSSLIVWLQCKWRLLNVMRQIAPCERCNANIRLLFSTLFSAALNARVSVPYVLAGDFSALGDCKTVDDATLPTSRSTQRLCLHTSSDWQNGWRTIRLLGNVIFLYSRTKDGKKWKFECQLWKHWTEECFVSINIDSIIGVLFSICCNSISFRSVMAIYTNLMCLPAESNKLQFHSDIGIALEWWILCIVVN